jgi:type VI secretion system protein ImpC
VRARRPLRKAQVKIREVEGKSGWYLIKLVVVPHLKYMGESFSLNETGKLDLA